MPFPTTGSNTELQAVNQILASVGQAPVTTLTTDETFVLNKVSNFTGSISGTTLTTTTANIPVGTYILVYNFGVVMCSKYSSNVHVANILTLI